MMITFLVWLYLFAVVYPWLIYPAILRMNRGKLKLQGPPYEEQEWVVITAGREAGDRGKKHIEYVNWLCSCHGNAKAVYVDDGSSAAEVHNLKRCAENLDLQHLTILDMESHVGKELALDAGREHAFLHGNPTRILFLDVGVRLNGDRQTLTALEALDIDPRFRPDDVAGLAFTDTVGDPGLYIRLEMGIRDLEDMAGGLIGAGGMALAMKTDYIMAKDLRAPADLTLVADARKAEGRMLHGGEQYQAIYSKPKNGQYMRSVRTAMRGMAGVETLPYEPWWNFKLVSHKHLRWLSSILIAVNPIALLLLIVRPSMILPHIAILHAAVLTASGKRVTKWEGTKR